MRKTMLNIIEWTLFGIIACLCGLLLLSNYSQHFPLKVYTVLTGSMQPAIAVGSMVVAVPPDINKINIGTVITFSSPDDPQKQIVHRVYSIVYENNQPVYTTKGDNNETLDNWKVYLPQLTGQAIASIPYLGYLSGYSKTPLGFLVIVGTPGLMLALIYLRYLISGIKEYADNKAKKAVGEYIQSERKAHTLHQMLGSLAIILFIPVAVYASFNAQVTANDVVFSTAGNFTTPSPTETPTVQPTATPVPTTIPTSTPSSTPCSSNCNTIILNQTGASTTINVNATTQEGSQSIQINNKQHTQQDQEIHTQQ